MKEDRLNKLVKNQIDDAEEAAKKIGPDFEKEDIHEFRVAVKSLRSLIRLLDSSTGNDTFILPSDLIDIYHTSGIIRDAQLEHVKISHMDLDLPGYCNHLEKIISKHKKSWEKCYSKKIFSHLESYWSEAKPIVLTEAVVEQFIAGKLASITRISKSVSPSDEELHGIRKQLKDIFYVLKIVPGNLISAFNTAKQVEISELKWITDLIGAYNDDRIFMEHIKSYSQELLKPADSMTIDNITTEMARQLTKRKKEICDQVNKYISSQDWG